MYIVTLVRLLSLLCNTPTRKLTLMFVTARRFGFASRKTLNLRMTLAVLCCAGVGGMAQAAPSGTAVVGAGEDPDTLY